MFMIKMGWVEGKPFVDPNLPAGYSPFNIQAIDGKLYVMYAKVDPVEGEEEAGEVLDTLIFLILMVHL